MRLTRSSAVVPLVGFLIFCTIGSRDLICPVTASDAHSHLPSQFETDKSSKFNQDKWATLTNDGLSALDQKKFKSAEQYFQAAVREASKAPCMTTYMVDSLVHTAEVYRQLNRKNEAKEYYDQALAFVQMLEAEKCPLCESAKESVPVIYGPHSEELAAWAKAQAAQLGDFKLVTKKRKNRPLWYCKMCEKAY